MAQTVRVAKDVVADLIPDVSDAQLHMALEFMVKSFGLAQTMRFIDKQMMLSMVVTGPRKPAAQRRIKALKEWWDDHQHQYALDLFAESQRLLGIAD